MKISFVPLTYKVALAFIAVLLPILVAFMVAYNNNKMQLEHLILEDLRAMADDKEGDTLFFLQMARDRINDFANDESLQAKTQNIMAGRGGEDGLSEYLVKNKLPLAKEIYRVSVISNKGRVIASTTAQVLGEDRSKEKFFINGMKEVPVTERDYGYMGEPEIAITAPVYSPDNKRKLGIIAGFIRLSSFKKILTGQQPLEFGAVSAWDITQLYRTIEIYIVNRDRLMLTESRFIKGSVLKQIVDTPPVRKCFEEGREMTGFYKDYRGIEVAGASMCFPSFEWTLVAEIDRDEALAPITRMGRYILATGSVVFVLMGGLFIFFHRAIVTQLKMLFHGSMSIAAGDFDVYVPIRTRDELGALTGAFNDMARSIKDKTLALRQSEERFRAMLDNTNNIVYLKDAEGRHILINRRFESLFHVKREEVIGKTVFDLFPAEFAEKFQEGDLKALSSERAIEVVEYAPHDDGTVHTYISIKFRLLDLKGEPYAVGGISTDITEIKKAEASLANAQRIAHLGNWDWDIVKNEVRWSDEIYRIFGVRPREFGATYEAFLSYVHPDDRAFVHMSVEDAFYRGAPYSIDHRIVLSTGEIRIVHETAEVMFDPEGRPVRMSGTVQDITERKRTEEAVRESEMKYRLLLETLQEGVWVLDRDGNTTFVNPRMAEMLGYTVEELIGKDIFSFYAEREVMEKRVERRKMGIREQLEAEFTRKDGRKITVTLLVAPITDEGGDYSGAIAGVIDVTDKKRSEEELRRLYSELEKRVAERTAELEAAKDNLEAVNKEIESFSYSVAHDLRTPLRLIDGFTRALFKDYKDRFDETGRDYLRRLQNASARMGQLIEDLLGLSYAMGVEMHHENVDLSSMARGIAGELRKAQPEREADIRIEDGLMARGDANLLKIVLENLIGNAWKFTGKTPNPKIEVGRAGREEGKDVYFVRDNGAGFNMKYSDRLFGAFQRLHSADEFPGTGIGLATVNRIIMRHNGRVWAEGEPGKGATFYFMI
ncbi:MAG: PAS domain S-box protein [Deltaproteobacteria bacterium]|nr:PAS domain S-box protein [Deltaproteobacteria bacterium]